MRKHGWQLPYHPLQVVAVSVFLALSFAFYVFFAPFVGKKLYQYIVMGLYSPLLLCVFGLYIWCAAADPADPGVFSSKKFLKISGKEKLIKPRESNVVGEPASSICDTNISAKGGGESTDKDGKRVGPSIEVPEAEIARENASSQCSSRLLGVLCSPSPFLIRCKNGSEESSERHASEDGMFYCSLCEVEVFKYSKHCRVCDKCIDSFDHHCRWLNNCIGKANYRKFFTLMVFSLFLVILQWSTGIFVLICCFLDRKRYGADISSKLGSSFTIVPYVIVVVICTILAMLATLPLAQLFFFHILLIKKGLSTYDYIIALREQEQHAVGGQQSPPMSQASSLTGFSSASSFNPFQRGAWCTPPRLFMEDQFDVVPPDIESLSSYGKRKTMEEPTTRKNPAVKISSWTLARLNAEEGSKAATAARNKSKILQPISSTRKTLPLPVRDTYSGQVITRLGSNSRGSLRIRFPSEIATEQPVRPSPKALSKRNASSLNMAPFQLEARSAFQSTLAMSSSAHVVGSSPESSLDSPDIHPFRVSSSGTEESRNLTGLMEGSGPFTAALAGIPLSRSTSDGFEASDGEDSEQFPIVGVVQGEQVNGRSLLFGSNRGARASNKLKALSSSFS